MRKYLYTALVLLTTLSAFGQGGVPLKTGKKYVTAIVEPGSGWVQVKQYPGNQSNANYSHARTSFVSFNINGKVYTNNDRWPDPLPSNIFILKDGVLKKTGDTIRCTWVDKEGLDLIQDVYPVIIGSAEQIVFRWKYRSKDTTTVSVAVQYLLDLQIGDDNYMNDAPVVLSRQGLRNKWSRYRSVPSNNVPPYFIAFQWYPINPTSPDFGLPRYGGTGYFDSIYMINLKLKRPTQFIIGDWEDLVPKRWFSTDIDTMPMTTYSDGSLAMTWSGVVSHITTSDVEIGSMSYGTAGIDMCYGKLDVFSFYPKTLTYENGVKLDTFVVESEFFQPDLNGLPMQDVRATLTVGKNLKIISPKPIDNNGRSQTQLLPNSGLVTTDSMSRIKWTLQVDTTDISRGDFTSSLKFSAVSSGGIVFEGLTGIDTCEKLIYFDLPINDGLPPVFLRLSPRDSSTRRVAFYELMPLDTGLKSITWRMKNAVDSANFTVTMKPITGCMKGIDTITIVQKDTTKGGCIYFTATDCADNITNDSICIEGKIFVPPDTLPPLVFDRINVSKYQKEFKVVDNRPDDSGLRGIGMHGFSLDTIGVSTNNGGSKDTVVVNVWLVDSLIPGCAYFKITDLAGNITFDTTCFVADTTLSVVNKQGENVFSILGNPSSGKAMIQLTLKKPQGVSIRIIDALGREVRRIDVKGLSRGENLIPLQTSELASGTYYIIVEVDGKQFTKSLKVVR